MINLFGDRDADAVFSPCQAGTECLAGEEFCEDPVHRPWRYRLIRTWDSTLPTACFLMLNPSTAGRERNDPTIRRCLEFSRRWGCGRFIGLNAYALRSTDPGKLAQHSDPVGPDNDRHIREVATEVDLVVIAWGAHRMMHDRAPQILTLLADAGVELRCLALTKHGYPQHPLYVPYGDHKPYSLQAPLIAGDLTGLRGM